MRHAHIELDTKTVTICPIGDLHIEKIQHDEKRLAKYIDWIVNRDDSVFALLGDYVDGRLPGHRFYSDDNVRPEFKTSDFGMMLQDKLKEALSPLRKRPGVAVKGNHDDALNYSGIARIAALYANAQYLGEEGLFRVVSNSRSLIGYARHIVGGGYLPGSKMNASVRSLNIAEADIYLHAHVHAQSNMLVSRWRWDGRRDSTPFLRQSLFAVAPAMMHNRLLDHTDYAGAKGLPPTDDGIFVFQYTFSTQKWLRIELDL